MSIDELELRAREMALASTLVGYPDDDLCETLSPLAPTLGEHRGACGVMRVLSQPGGLDELRSSYIALFDSGKGRCSLYETEYGHMRGIAKGNDLADIAGFYQAFGLKLDDEGGIEMLDHIAVELEFYALLLLKQRVLQGDVEGSEIVLDARRKFLTDHLGRFAHAVASRPEVAGHEAYGPLLAWCASLVSAECEALGVKPPPLDYFDDAEARQEPSCGAVKLPVLPS